MGFLSGFSKVGFVENYGLSSKQNFYEIYLETIKSQNKLQPKTNSDRFLSVSDIRKEGCFVTGQINHHLPN